MKGILLLILLSLSHLTVGQKVGIINDPDRYVNVRSGPAGSYEVLGKITEASRFTYWPDSNTSWWKVRGTIRRGSVIEGYMHKSRIQPYYSEREGCGCYVDYLKDERPVFHAEVGDITISICGWLIQKQSERRVLAGEFHVFDCANEKELLFVGAVDECYVEKAEDDLKITFLKFLPFGKDYSFVRWPVSTLTIKNEGGEAVVSNSRFDFEPPKWEPAKIQQLLQEAKAQKDKSYSDKVRYEKIIINLAVASILGNSEALEIFNSMEEKYFGFVIDGHLREQYNYFKGLVRKSLSK